MRVLFFQNVLYFPLLGGANKSLQRTARQLSVRGHQCAILCPAFGSFGPANVVDLEREVSARGYQLLATSDRCWRYLDEQVQVHALLDGRAIQQVLADLCLEFRPDIILLPAEDAGYQFLGAAWAHCREKTIYLCQTPWSLPFGPASLYPNKQCLKMVSELKGVITISHFLRDYIWRYSGLTGSVVQLPVFDEPDPALTFSGDGLVMIINPSKVKGISIFLDLASRMPESRFAAVPTWATSSDDLASLEAAPNILLLEADEDIGKVLQRAHVLLVPSLWDEGFGYVCIEAMAQGIPVIASNSGGLVEAKLGVDYLLPVNTISKYLQQCDNRSYPIPVVPTQDISPWQTALEELLYNPLRYEQLANLSKFRALEFIKGATIDRFEKVIFGSFGKTQTSSSTVIQEAPGLSKKERFSSDERQRTSLLAAKALASKRARMRSAALTTSHIPEEKERLVPVSEAQMAMCFTEQLYQESSGLILSEVLHIKGETTVSRLEKVIQLIVDRHEALRTCFLEKDGQFFQRIFKQLQVVIKAESLRILDKSDDWRSEIPRLVDKEIAVGFDIKLLPLFRIKYFDLGSNESLLVFCAHHLIFDGWSIRVLLKEFVHIYSGLASGKLSALQPPQQYADWAVANFNQRRNEWIKEALNYWKQYLGAEFPQLELQRSNRITHNVDSSARTERISLHGRERKIRELVSRHQTTVFALMLAVFEILLFRYTGQTTFFIGVPMLNRGSSGAMDTIGLFVNSVAFRASFTYDITFFDFLKQINSEIRSAISYEALPFNKVVEALSPGRKSKSPIFQVMASEQFSDVRDLRAGELSINSVPNNKPHAGMDLTLVISQQGEEISAWFEYRKGIFEPHYIRNMAKHFGNLLVSIVTSPQLPLSAHSLVSGPERETLLAYSAGKVELGNSAESVIDRFEETVRLSPTSVAVWFQDEKISYWELNSRANKLANYLIDLGVGPEELIPVMLDRSPQMVIALLGIMKSGGAYVPIDPKYPKERVKFVLQNCGAKLAITSSDLLESFTEVSTKAVNLNDVLQLNVCWQNPVSKVSPKNMAYMIYTSGSTGVPKGAVNTHEGLYNRLVWMQDEFKLASGDRIIQKTPYTFDVSVWEFFWPLMFGASLVIAKPGGHQEPDYLVSEITRTGVTIVHFVPSMLKWFVEQLRNRECECLRLIICSGEALPADLVVKSRDAVPSAKIFNLYGPTECSIDVTFWDCASKSLNTVVPIGVPIRNNYIHILDRELNLVPEQLIGEIFIGGIGLGRCYLNRPDLTAERFLPDPFSDEPGSRLYRTGDLGSWKPNGSIEFFGRADQQLKIRGFRVEPGEIEALLKHHKRVKDAVVIMDSSQNTSKLIAYITLTEMSHSNISGSEDDLIMSVKALLKDQLPEYMVPSEIFLLDGLPLTANGKLDRKSLAPKPPAQKTDQMIVRPRNKIEEEIAKIWREVLNKKEIGVTNNFFDIGGHSLLLMQVGARLRAKFGVDVPLRNLFDAPTIAESSRLVLRKKLENLNPELRARTLNEAAPRVYSKNS